MEKIKWLPVLMLLAGAFCLAGCLNEDDEEGGVKVTGHEEYVMTVASKKLAYVIFNGSDFFTEAYAVRKEGTQAWEPLTFISGLDYEDGYSMRCVSARQVIMMKEGANRRGLNINCWR